MRTGRPPKALDMQRVISQFARGATMREIAESTSVCHTTIWRRLEKEWLRLGLKSRKAYRRYLLENAAKRRNIQEVIIKRYPTYTTYIVVGKKVVTRRN